MADENKKFPNGWGSDEDDDDYGFIDDADEDDEDSAWGNGSPFKKKESVTDSNENEGSVNGQTESSVPAQEVKTSKNSAAPVPSVNPPYNQGYVIQKQKSTPLFIIVIIILVLIIGVLCTAIFMVNKNKKTNNSEKSGVNSVDEISENTSKNTENDNTETEIPDITTAATTETITESTTNIADLNIDTSEAVKKTLYAHLEEEFNNEKKDTYYYFDRDAKYALYDINADGIDELFISYNGAACNIIKIYIYNNDSYVLAERFGDCDMSVCLDEHFVLVSLYGGAVDKIVYRIIDNEILQKDELKMMYGSLENGNEYYHNGHSITESEYNQSLAQYEDKDLINITDQSRPFSELIDMSVYTKNLVSSSDPYSDIKQEILHSVDNEDYRGKNSHIENAPSDMVFYSTGNRSSLNISNPIVYEGPGTNYSQIPTYQDRFDIVGENSSWYYIQWYEGAGRFAHPCYGYINKDAVNKNTSEYTDKSNLIATGKVITEKDDLNMRESDSADSKIIKTIPKGHYVGIISEYGDWLYIKYYADTNSPIYYGFVSKQFIEITERYGNW